MWKIIQPASGYIVIFAIVGFLYLLFRLPMPWTARKEREAKERARGEKEPGKETPPGS